ncbi:MAG: glutathione-disulfide reductase [Roseovarius sp.]|nr:glutathione-disulfide reductase [Roseovarius sp.]
MSNSFDYDLFVIGGGSGGVRAARMAAQSGAKTALAEEDRYGGTCVIRGCVPKKLMVYASEYSSTIGDAKAYGWKVQAGGFSWNEFKGKLHSELDRLEGIYRSVLKDNGVECHDTRARLMDPHTVELADGATKTAKHILIATGGTPVKPNTPGAECAITSNEIFHLRELPKSLLIIGGGYIACEFACILGGLGANVTQYYRGERILRGFDVEARDVISREMIRSGIDLNLDTNISGIEPKNGGHHVTAEDGTVRMFEQVMFATGRSPNSGDMNLRKTGVKLGTRGEIITDDYSQTSVPSIYAIGDVTNRVNLTPVAIREGMAFVQTVFEGRPTPVDHDLVATAVFTRPEFGSVGLSEEDARKNEAVDIYRTTFKPMQQGFAGREEMAFMKLVVSRSTNRVLGCHIVAPGAGEMIQLAAIAVKMGATKNDFDRTCAVHPTMSEELVTMKDPS